MSFTQNLRHSRISASSKKYTKAITLWIALDFSSDSWIWEICVTAVGGLLCWYGCCANSGTSPPKKTLENGWPFEPVGIFIFFLGQILGLLRHIRNCWLINWSTRVDIVGKEVAIGEIPSIHQRGKFLVDKNLAKRHNSDAKRNDVICTAWVSVLLFLWGCNVLWIIFLIRLVCGFSFFHRSPWVMFEDLIIFLKIWGYVLEYLRTVRRLERCWDGWLSDYIFLFHYNMSMPWIFPKWWLP